MNRIRSIAAILSIVLVLTMGPGSAQIQVFDSANYAQNLQTAANTLKQINNQLTALQNQTQMLLNQAKHLASLPTSLVSAIDQTFTQTQNILRNVDRIAYDVQAIDTLIGDINPPVQLMQTQTDRKIAEEQRKTYEVQEAAQKQRQQLVRQTSLADIQQQVVGAEQGVSIAELHANANVTAIARVNVSGSIARAHGDGWLAGNRVGLLPAGFRHGGRSRKCGQSDNGDGDREHAQGSHGVPLAQ